MQWWARLLRGLGISVAHLDDLAPRWDDTLAREGRYVFVSNDQVSRMDAVSKWLQRTFNLDKRTAALKMYGIHHHGLGVLGPFSAEEAAERMTIARVIARDLGLASLVFSQEPPEKRE